MAEKSTDFTELCDLFYDKGYRPMGELQVIIYNNKLLYIQQWSTIKGIDQQ